MRTRLVPKNNQTSQQVTNSFDDCPICEGEKTVMVEIQSDFTPTEPPTEELIETYLENYLCIRCGYTTTSDMLVGSEMVDLANKKSPKLVKDLSIADNVRNLVWFPSVVNITEKGIIYPDGSSDEWSWVVAPYVALTEEEKSTYLSTSEESKFQWRLAVEKSTKFDKLDFQNAIAFLGALVEKQTNA